MGRRKKTKSTYGAGSVYQDKKTGGWIAQVYDGHGKLIRRRAASREAAEALAQELTRLKGKAIDIRGGRQTVETFANAWFESKASAGRKAKTLEFYRAQLEYYILPALGSYALDEVTVEDVEALFAKIRKKLSEQSLRHVYQVLSQVFTQAYKRAYIERNPVQLVERPKVERQEPAIFSIQQAREFLDSIRGERFEALYHLATLLGPRRGELLGLRWMDINREERTIRISQQVVEVNNVPAITTPKSATSARVLPLTARLDEQLRVHWQRQQKERSDHGTDWQEHGLVFPNERGGVFFPTSLSRQFRKLSKEAGFPNMHFHLLRHVAASLLAEIGANEALIGAVLGHSGGSVTRRYTHIPLATMRRSVEDVERVLWKVDTKKGEKQA